MPLHPSAPDRDGHHLDRLPDPADPRHPDPAAPETKLLLIGIFTAITAAVQSSLTTAVVNVPTVGTATGLASAPLMRIAVILVLAAVGLMLLDRAAPRAAAASEEEGPHVG